MASKGTVHGHHDVVVGAEDVHVEVTVGAAHLTLAAVRFFNGLRGEGGRHDVHSSEAAGYWESRRPRC